MRLFWRYLKQHWRLYIVGAIFCAVFLVSFRLYRLPLKAVLYPAALCVLIGLILLYADFLRIKKRHEALQQIRSITDTLADDLLPAEGIEDTDYQEIIRLIRKEHSQYRTVTNQRYSDMVDYYTVWAHQIKTPIASMRLHLQNEDSPLTRKLFADLHRIEQYVEMVLTFLRLNADSTDYVFREYDVDSIVRQAVRKFSHEFIDRKLQLVYELVEAKVVTDEKWLCFVIEQVLSNALKYTQHGSITVSMDAGKHLSIRDTGIGIAPEDLPRIFDNGYTGYNGRSDKKASGIGLYLCKRICTNLGHRIHAESVMDEGTTVTIDLSQKRIQAD